ncbi:unnamed protein product, partial [Mesorhabditis spiculigera]
MATIDGVEVRPIVKVERASLHSHIRGLGLTPSLEPTPVADGMAGQVQARKGAGVIVKMIKEGKISGRAILINGPVGSGKTAIATGIAKELGADAPFVAINAAEIFSKEISYTEALIQAFRQAIAIRIKETSDVLCGEVVSIEVDRPVSGQGPKLGKLTLRTADMESIYEMGGKLIEKMMKMEVQSGDVLHIDRTQCSVIRVGRTKGTTAMFDAMGSDVKLVNLPEGELQKKIEQTHTVSLHEIDVINSRAKGYEAIFTGDTGEISHEVRAAINKKVTEWRDEGRAQIVSGVLFIDEAHLLTMRCFSFLNRLIEGDISPLLIIATNAKGVRQIRESEHRSPMGIPRDFLDRSLVIKTRNYSFEEFRQILLIRAQEEDISITYSMSRVLSELAYRMGLRYALQLLAISDIIRKRDPEAKELAKPHIQEATALFSDVARAQLKSIQKRIQFAQIRQQADLLMLKERARLRLLTLQGEQHRSLRALAIKEAEQAAENITANYEKQKAQLNERKNEISQRMTDLGVRCKLDAARCGHTGTTEPQNIIF